MRVVALALIPLLALAGCGGGDDANSAGPVTSATPVAKASAPAGQSWLEVVAKTPDGYRQGNPDAPIKLVEYGSRNCPVCGLFAQQGVEPLRERYVSTGQVSYEFRDFLVHGAPDFAAALLNQCVPTEAFFTVLDQMFANQEEFGQRMMQLEQTHPQLVQQLQTMTPAQAAAAMADATGMVDFMKQRGVSEAKARQCLADPKAIEDIARVNAEAVSKYNVGGTPTFFINGQVVPNASNWAALEPALKAAGAR